jgi:D-alanyl-D-alanine carboxypeptidase
VQQLLNMTAGVFPYTFDDSFLEAYYADPNMSFTKDDFMAILQRHDPLFAPGEKTEYSDSNYYLLGLIVETAILRPLGDVIQSFIREPLGMTHTSYPTTSELPVPFARGYIPQGDGPPRDVTISNPAVAEGAGAMISTLGDLKIWAKALATGSLLKPATQKLRLQTTVLSSIERVTASYGLGILDINGFLGHDGAILGYGSVVLYLPSRDATIVVLSNGNTLFGSPSVNTAIALVAYLFPRQFPDGIE